MRSLVHQRHTAKNVLKIVETLASSLHMTRFSTNTSRRLHVVPGLETIGFEWSQTGELRCHIIKGNVFAIKVLVNVCADFDRYRIVRRVLVKVGNVGEA